MWAVVADGEDEEHCGGDGVGDDGGGRWCDRDPPRSLFSRLLPLASLQLSSMTIAFYLMLLLPFLRHSAANRATAEAEEVV